LGKFPGPATIQLVVENAQYFIEEYSNDTFPALAQLQNAKTLNVKRPNIRLGVLMEKAKVAFHDYLYYVAYYLLVV